MTALEEKIEELRKRITAFDLDFDQGEALDELIAMIPAVQSLAYAEGERAGFKKAHKVLMQDAKLIKELKDELGFTSNTYCWSCCKSEGEFGGDVWCSLHREQYPWYHTCENWMERSKR